MTTTSEIITNFEAEQKNVVFSALSEYLSTGLFVDVSLVCKGQVLRAHKVVLSSSSKYFRDFFRHQPNISIIDLDKELEPNDLNLTLEDIKLIIGILYCVGTVEISPLRIESLLVCAQVLGIPTLILFLKRIRESINETKIVKDGQLLYYGGKLLGPNTSRFDMTNVSPRHSAHRRPSGGEMMYILSSPTRQAFPPPPVSVSQSFPLNPPPPPPNPPPPSVQHGGHSGDERRSAATRQGGFPLLDLSLVKPMTASCVNSPESPHENNSSSWMPSGTPSPVPGPSGINTRNLQQQQQPSAGTLLTTTSSSCRSDSTPPPQPGPSSRGGGVTDSMLTHQSKQRPLLNMHRRSVSRISNSSYSSLTLNCLQSPQRTTSTADLSTDNLLHHHNQPRRMNSVSMLDGIDPNLLMQLNNLPANQLDDLENVLLPHLTSDGRSCQPSPNGDHLLDLPGMDINDADQNNGGKDGNHHMENQRDHDRMKSHNNLAITPSQTSTTLTSTLSMGVSNAPSVSQFHSFSTLPSVSALPTNIRAASAESNPDPFTRNLGFSGNTRILSSTPACLDLSRPHDGQFLAPTERPFRPLSRAPSNQSGHSNSFLNISSHSSSRRDISPRARSPKRARVVSHPSAAVEPIPSLTPGVRLTPYTIYDQSLNKPVRLTPMGSVVLAPLNNLLAPSAIHLPSTSSENIYTSINNLATVNNTKPPADDHETETDSSSVKQSGQSISNQANNAQIMADLSNLSMEHDNNEQQEPLNESLTDTGNIDEEINTGNIRESNVNHISNQESNVGPSNNQESAMKTRSTNSETERNKTNDCQQVMPPHSQAPSTMSLAPVVSSQSIPGCSIQQAAQPSGEIIMNLDQVCPTGQRMKFSVPGVSQAVTLNFSAEALQEMKNAALRTTRANLHPEQGTSSAGAAIAAAAPEASTAHQDHTASEFIDYSNQSEEISSSRANFDNDDLLCEDEPCSNIEPETEQDVNDNDSSEQQDHVATRTESPATKKQKKSRKNLRQKLKSNRATRRAKSGGHSAEVKYSCTVCDKSFPQEQQLIKHLRFHVKKIFTCELCCKVFDDRWKYDKHMEEAHDKKEAKKCPECAQIFYQATELMAHIQTCHPENKNLECKICHLSFNRKHQLIKHVTTWHPNSDLPLCQICMELFEDKNEQEQHECSGAQVQSNKIVCHKHPKPMEFANKGDLEEHMKTHHDTSSKDLQISCYICQKSFLLRSNLWRHLRNIHNMETGGNIKKKEFNCNTCDKKFYYKNDLTQHMEVHNTEKKYKCDTCHRTFLSMARATRHGKECQQEFICQLCGKQLSSSAKLRAHALTHSDDRPFKCVFCECKFKEKRSLISHVKKKHEKDDIEEGKSRENEIIDEHETVEDDVTETLTTGQDESSETVQNTDDNNTHNTTDDAQNVQHM